jgi:hypothetical protein
MFKMRKNTLSNAYVSTQMTMETLSTAQNVIRGSTSNVTTMAKKCPKSIFVQTASLEILMRRRPQSDRGGVEKLSTAVTGRLSDPLPRVTKRSTRRVM